MQKGTHARQFFHVRHGECVEEVGRINGQGANVKHENHGDTQDQIEEHSLPGTNQAGKGPDSSEENDHENRPGAGKAQHPDQFEEHSLPGTNQAGKGPRSDPGTNK